MKWAALGVLLATAAAVGGQCPDSNWHHLGDRCYWWPGALLQVTGDKLTEACRDVHPSSLPVSVHSTEVTAYLHYLTEPYEAWLGLSRSNISSGWSWEDGSEADFFFWARRQPAEEGNCAAANYDKFSGEWGAWPCEDLKFFLCELPASTPTTPTTAPTTTPTPVACPDSSWSQLHGVCYWASGDDYIYGNQVAEACRQLHPSAQPVAIHDSETNALLYSMMDDSLNTFLGLTRAGDSSPWIWADGSDGDFINWGSGQPVDGVGGWCAVMYHTEEVWYSQDCSYSYDPYFCQLLP